jgi:hypothetical protein
MLGCGSKADICAEIDFVCKTVLQSDIDIGTGAGKICCAAVMEVNGVERNSVAVGTDCDTNESA